MNAPQQSGPNYEQKFPAFYQVAAKSEVAILVATVEIRECVLLEKDRLADPSAAQTKQDRNRAVFGTLFLQYAGVLRQTQAWQKLGEADKTAMERDLLTLP